MTKINQSNASFENRCGTVGKWVWPHETTLMAGPNQWYMCHVTKHAACMDLWMSSVLHGCAKNEPMRCAPSKLQS